MTRALTAAALGVCVPAAVVANARAQADAWPRLLAFLASL